MEWSHVNGSSDSMVPAELDGLEVLSPSREDWFQWGVNGFARKYNDTSEEENLANLSSDTRVPPWKESMVPQFHLCEGSNCSSPCEDGLVHDYCMRTSDDLFSDLPDFEIQTSMESMDDILLYKHKDSFSLLDRMYLENSYESMHITDSTDHPWNSRISVLEHSETLMKDLSRREDAMDEDPNFKVSCSIDPPSPIFENFITNVVEEPMCIAATVLQELENVILQLDIKTRICIQDALYRLANRAKEQHNINLCQSGSFKDLPSSEFSCGISRQELSENLEPMTNEIDRAVAALMFDRPDYKLSFLKNKQTGAASG